MLNVQFTLVGRLETARYLAVALEILRLCVKSETRYSLIDENRPSEYRSVLFITLHNGLNRNHVLKSPNYAVLSLHK